jgi:hypothetical protein
VKSFQIITLYLSVACLIAFAFYTNAQNVELRKDVNRVSRIQVYCSIEPDYGMCVSKRLDHRILRINPLFY